MIRAGMDVEVWGRPGEWMVAGFDGRKVRCVSLDCPGDVCAVPEGDLRPIWREGRYTPAERLAAEEVPHDAWLAAQGVDPDGGECS